jgi:nucleoside-diphosphate-sugar epimerase
VKILITGNMGYVGPAVIEQLRSSYPDASLIGLDMGYFGPVLSAADALPEARMDVQYFGDVRQPPDEVFRDLDAVVHLAGISNDPMGSRFERVTLDINHRATISLAARAKAAGASRFVFASSCSVYGAASEAAKDEDSPVDPLTAYSRSKIAAENDLRPLASKGFSVTALRFATACGMSSRLRLDLVLNDFVAAATASKTIQIMSDGTPWRPLIHIRDMARAIDWAIRRGGEDYLRINVGMDEWNYQVKDLARAVAEAIPGVTIWINPDAGPDKRSYRVDFGRFRRHAADHQPRYTLARTVAELAEGLRRMGFDDPDFRKSRYIRLNFLSGLLDRGLLGEDLAWNRDATAPALAGAAARS